MQKIMFVCYGNICRSPMAEFILKDIVKKAGMEKNFRIQSSATSREEIGNDIYYAAKDILKRKHIPFEKRAAMQLTKQDYEQYDWIIGMEDMNVRHILKIVGEDKQKKVYKLLDFTNSTRDIADPWYTGNFQKAYEDILTGCQSFFSYLQKIELA